MNNRNEKRGFSGLSDLVTEVTVVDEVVESKSTSKPKLYPSPPKASTRSGSQRKVETPSPILDPLMNQRSFNLKKILKFKWYVVALAIVIWLASIDGQDTKTISYNSQTPSTSYNYKQIDPTLDVKNPSNNQTIGLKGEKPLTSKKSASEKLKASELREGLIQSGDHLPLLKEIEKGGFSLDFNGVCQLQEILRYLCLYSGKIDGIIGSRSKKAINDLIEKEGLRIKNKIDSNLLDFLEKNYLNKPSPCSYSNHPKNGYVFLSSGENIAPLQIRIPDYGKDFFVKLVNPYTNQSIKEFYVRSGQIVETNVPLGTFQLKYAAGNNWIGKYNLFGLDTICSKTNKEFSFYQTGEQVNGYTVELILQPGGNLRTSKINLEDF